MSDKFKFSINERQSVYNIFDGYLSYNQIAESIDRIESIIQDRGNSIEETVWQKCPKCDGQGTVFKPPWIAGDVYEWSSTALTHQCNVCNGAMILPSPPKQPKK